MKSDLIQSRDNDANLTEADLIRGQTKIFIRLRKKDWKVIPD